jgi:16S rRNA (uracil1498-N3)-methyltransferase
MSRRRFYAPPSAFNIDGRSVRLQSEEARHLVGVLRLKPGDEAFVFDGEGREYRCLVAAQGRDRSSSSVGHSSSVLLEIGEEVSPARPESSLRLTLCVALLKGEKFDLVVQKTTELGVWKIVPVLTKFADIRLKDETDGVRRVARWRRIALEAAKQSGRARVPEIHPPLAFTALIESSLAGETERRLIFSEREGRGLDETSTEWASMPLSLGAMIGPEGGWADEELGQAALRGWSIITLGGRVLRAETAAIVAASLLQHRFGDLV